MLRKIMMVSLMVVASMMTGCFSEGLLSIDEKDYELSNYTRQRTSGRRVSTSGFPLGRKKYNDLIYLSNETQSVQVWIRIGYDAKYKYMGTGTFDLHVDNWQDSGEAGCIIKTEGKVYNCVSGNLTVSREGLMVVAGSIVNAQARIKYDSDIENIKTISLQYRGDLLKWRIGLKQPYDPNIMGINHD